jgi:hypothetical protein
MIIGDRRLSSTAKIVGATLLLKFRNKETGRCNPSYRTVADVIGMSRDTAMDAIKELVAAGYLVVQGTRGGSTCNTNQYEFRLPTNGNATTGGEFATSGSDADGSGAEATKGMESAPHEPSIEPSRTTIADQIDADRPDRSLRRSPRGALRDPAHRERTEVVQDRLAKRFEQGWVALMQLPAGELERLTELERTGGLTDEMLELAIAGIKLAVASEPRSARDENGAT